MPQNRKLTAMKNIGAKIAGHLNAVGIHTEADLRRIGPVAAHARIRRQYPTETLPLCYYLYTFEGALTDRHWNDIGEQRKRVLRDGVD